MKPLLLAIAFSCAIPVYLAAQCDTYLSIETLIKIKKDFDEAEDLLINCFTKTKDEVMEYDDGINGRLIDFSAKKRVKYGDHCTFPRESITLYYRKTNMYYSVSNSAQYLKIKNVVRTQGKRTDGYSENVIAYLYRGFKWEFETIINDECSANHYRISISNP